MAHQQNVTFDVVFQAFANLSDNARLCGNRRLPTANAFLGTRKELICNDFELFWREKPGRTAIILVHRLTYD